MKIKITGFVIALVLYFATSVSAGMVFYDEDAVKLISDPMGIELPKEWEIKGGVSSSTAMQGGRFAVYRSRENSLESFINSVPKDLKVEPIKRFKDGYNKIHFKAVSWVIHDDSWAGYRLTKDTIPYDLVLDILVRKSNKGWKICCMAYSVEKELDYEIPAVYEWWLESQRTAIAKEVFDGDESAFDTYTLVFSYAPFFSLWRDQDDLMFYGRGYQGKLKTTATETKDVIQAFIAENLKKVSKSLEDDPVDPFSHTISENRQATHTVKFLEQILADADKWVIMKSVDADNSVNQPKNPKNQLDH